MTHSNGTGAHAEVGGGRSARLDRILAELVGQVPEIEAASVVSFDGLPMASALPPGMDEDRVAAMSAALLSLGERAAEGLGRGELSQVYVEGENGTVFLDLRRRRGRAGRGRRRGAKVGMMLFEIRRAAGARAVLRRAAGAAPSRSYEPSDRTPRPSSCARSPRAAGPSSRRRACPRRRALELGRWRGSLPPTVPPSAVNRRSTGAEMKLEGSLDAFSLPDIFQLLSFTKKSGGLHLRHDGCGRRRLLRRRPGHRCVRGRLAPAARPPADRRRRGRRRGPRGAVAGRDRTARASASSARCSTRAPSTSSCSGRRRPTSRSTRSSTCSAGSTATSPSSWTRPTPTTSASRCRSRSSWPTPSRAPGSWDAVSQVVPSAAAPCSPCRSCSPPTRRSPARSGRCWRSSTAGAASPSWST